MDKNAIKKYAVWARRELITRVSQRAGLYEITAEGCGDPKAESVRGRVLSDTEKSQRAELVRQIQKKGFEQVMEEVAYTWFNRFAALRFMEVNGSLPSRVRVFTDAENNFKPQILTEAIDLELDGLDRQKVYQLKNDNDDEALFKYLIITQCNALNSILPVMFQRINDCTELLFPENLLREGSVIEQMVTMIPEEDWTDQVQIIGWLYQYYNYELNSLVYDGTLSKAKVPKELISAATTIYTPNWPAQYMVENSLGRLWLERMLVVDGSESADDREQALAQRFGWKYYLPEAPQEPEVHEKLNELRREYADLKPEDIRVIDPCMGSGHILCVLFDTLMQIYEDYGYTARNAVTSILENNLWGLDIDQRAAQLAYFSVMMKAVQYDGRLFRRRGKPVPQPHVYWPGEYAEGQEFGSLLVVKELEVEPELDDWDMFLGDFQAAHDRWTFRRALAQKYHVVVTNPPYLGSSRFNPFLEKYVKKHYKDVKTDLSMAMYYASISRLSEKAGYVAFITTSSWMFLSSFEKLRHYLNTNCCISSLVDFGTELFDGKVGHNPIVAWITRTIPCNNNITGVRLVDYCYARRNKKEHEFFNPQNYHTVKQDSFKKIPGEPVAYWVSESIFEAFDKGKLLGSFSSVSEGIKTGDNDRYLRLWYEINCAKFSFGRAKTNYKWYPHHKGGDYRKWYGNLEWVINWEFDGKEIRKARNSGLQGKNMYFHEFAGWSKISSKGNPLRYYKNNTLFDSGAPAISNNQLKICLALVNSMVGVHILQIISPTLNLQVGDVKSIPLLPLDDNDNAINTIVDQCISISNVDWDSFETSWDFQRHPLIEYARWTPQQVMREEKNGYLVMNTLQEAYEGWEEAAETRFQTLKSNEEQLNRIFIDLYGLQDELTPEVEDKDVTVRRADLQREIKSLISYAVGCMFGRYSLDADGLIYAGGAWNPDKYASFPADPDNIIPICDDEYFADDIVGRFVEFLRVVYGEDTLEANLKYVADALGGKGTPKQVIRNYFLNDFYKDHCKIYQKRPIYWLFDSGKKNGFKCLIYLHRYQPDTIARIRTDYVHEQQSRYRTAIADLERRSGEGSASDRVKVKKTLERVTAQAEELRVYEEKIHHLADQMIAIDLDDGVKKNYEIFKDVLAKIR